MEILLLLFCKIARAESEVRFLQTTIRPVLEALYMSRMTHNTLTTLGFELN